MSNISTKDLLRVLDERIGALQQARNALAAAFSDETPATGGSHAGNGTAPRAARVAELTLPKALARVMQPEYLTVKDLVGEIERRERTGEFRVGGETNTTSVRTGMARIYRKQGWEKGALHGQVAYRRPTTGAHPA